MLFEFYIYYFLLCKGLIPAIEEELLDTEHKRYGRHIYQAWVKKWKGAEWRKKFWVITKSSFEVELKDNLKELAKLGKGTCEDLLSYPAEDWAKVYHCPHLKCDVVKNNTCGTFNSLILSARHKSIIMMLEEIRVKIMNRIRTMRDFAQTQICDISPMAMDYLEKNTTITISVGLNGIGSLK